MSNLTSKTKIYLNNHELKRLDNNAEKAGLSRSAYVRHLLHTVLPIPFTKTNLHSIIRELKAHGQAVNQLATKNHPPVFFDLHALELLVEQIQAVMDRFMEIYAERKLLLEEAYKKLNRKPNGEKHPITIRLSEEDKLLLNRHAKEACLTQSAYVSFLIYGIRPPEKPTSDFFAVLNELDKIGLDLSHIWLCAEAAHDPNAEAFHQFSQWQQNTVSAMIRLV